MWIPGRSLHRGEGKVSFTSLHVEGSAYLNVRTEEDIVHMGFLRVGVDSCLMLFTPAGVKHSGEWEHIRGARNSHCKQFFCHK